MPHRVKKKEVGEWIEKKDTVFLNIMNIWRLSSEKSPTLNKISIFSREIYTVINYQAKSDRRYSLGDKRKAMFAACRGLIPFPE